jgi:hypothetical protein
MERTPLNARITLCLCLLSTIVAFAHELRVPHLSARVSDADVVAQGDAALATFKIHVTNNEDSPLGNVWVVFPDATSLPVGDVVAGGTVTVESQNRVIERSLPESQSIPIPVTFTLSFEGESVEVPWILDLGAEQAR